MDEIVQFERFEVLGKEIGRAHKVNKIHLADAGSPKTFSGVLDLAGLEAKTPPRQGFLRTALSEIWDKIHRAEVQMPQTAGFIMEIAQQLYEAVSLFGDDAFKDREIMANGFMQYFMKGYVAENEMDMAELKEINLFLRLVEWEAHTNLYHTWNLSDMTQEQCDYFEQTKTRIIHNIPIVAFRKEWLNIKNVDVIHTPVVTVKLQPSFALLFVS